MGRTNVTPSEAVANLHFKMGLCELPSEALTNTSNPCLRNGELPQPRFAAVVPRWIVCPL
jgi:hypothetical protein